MMVNWRRRVDFKPCILFAKIFGFDDRERRPASGDRMKEGQRHPPVLAFWVVLTVLFDC